MANIPDIKVVYDSMDELITVPDVAKKLGTSQRFIHKLIQLKMLPAIYFGRYPRVRKFTLNAFLEQFEGKNLIELVKAAERNRDNENKD
ncbi:helix-turn-helix domain-containing protein [uncultured Megasphaera sp.]|uniref:helix-turn-helix domain-containing protein n=1 Tax=uncultured Megasphaera sp. TaxID=165188 RepID=UPI002673299B|nr:helix-turn-helix domain-containing protein [uncultured Megasphaera sp.]